MRRSFSGGPLAGRGAVGTVKAGSDWSNQTVAPMISYCREMGSLIGRGAIVTDVSEQAGHDISRLLSIG